MHNLCLLIPMLYECVCVFMGVALALPGEKVFFQERHIIQLNPTCAWIQARTHVSALLVS